jgi:hypothetical protein
MNDLHVIRPQASLRYAAHSLQWMSIHLMWMNMDYSMLIIDYHWFIWHIWIHCWSINLNEVYKEGFLRLQFGSNYIDPLSLGRTLINKPLSDLAHLIWLSSGSLHLASVNKPGSIRPLENGCIRLCMAVYRLSQYPRQDLIRREIQRWVLFEAFIKSKLSLLMSEETSHRTKHIPCVTWSMYVSRHSLHPPPSHLSPSLFHKNGFISNITNIDATDETTVPWRLIECS